MNCQKCGANITENDYFCEECGTKLNTTSSSLACKCPDGQSKPDKNGYCEDCGIRCMSNPGGKDMHTEISPDSTLAVVSDIGLKHKSNQDAGIVVKCENGNVILVVADGVSSSVNAKSASETAVKAVIHILIAYDNITDVAETMQKAIKSAHEAIIALPYKNQNPNLDSPETTVVAAIKVGNQITVGWIGDSRAYLITDGVEEKLTIDDSWVEEVVQAGDLTREEAQLDKRAHYVTQVLGMTDDSINIHVLNKDISNESSLLLCSDGLWNYLPEDGDITNILSNCETQSDALAICKYLVNYANEQGGHDNITVALNVGLNSAKLE